MLCPSSTIVLAHALYDRSLDLHLSMVGKATEHRRTCACTGPNPANPTLLASRKAATCNLYPLPKLVTTKISAIKAR